MYSHTKWYYRPCQKSAGISGNSDRRSEPVQMLRPTSFRSQAPAWANMRITSLVPGWQAMVAHAMLPRECEGMGIVNRNRQFWSNAVRSLNGVARHLPSRPAVLSDRRCDERNSRSTSAHRDMPRTRTSEAVPIVLARVDSLLCRPEKGGPDRRGAGSKGLRERHDGHPILGAAYTR